MVEEADDGGRLFEFGFDFGNERQGLGVEVIQVEDDECGLGGVGRIDEARDGFLVALDEFHLDAELARSLLNLGLEEEVFDEAEDARGGVFAGGCRRGPTS